MTEQPPRRRAHENLPGEATLSQLLPKGWTLLTVIAMGVGYAAISYTTIGANAEDMQAVQQTQAQHAERLRNLENSQSAQSSQLTAINEEQKRANNAAADRQIDNRAGRREIIDVLNSIRENMVGQNR